MNKSDPERTVQIEVTTETRLIPIPPIEVTTEPFFPERTVQFEVTKGELLPRPRTTRTSN